MCEILYEVKKRLMPQKLHSSASPSDGVSDVTTMTETALAVVNGGRDFSAPVTAERNPALVYLASLSATGRRSMRVLLEKVARFAMSDLGTAAWSVMRFEHVVAFRSRLVEDGHAPATVNTTLSALRGVARAAWNLGQISGEDYQRIAAVKGVSSRGRGRGAARRLLA